MFFNGTEKKKKLFEKWKILFLAKQFEWKICGFLYEKRTDGIQMSTLNTTVLCTVEREKKVELDGKNSIKRAQNLKALIKIVQELINKLL